jgi:magnesium transporter
MSYRLLVRAPGEENLEPCDPDELDQHQEAGALLWLDVRTRELSEMDQLGARFGFDPAAIEDVIDVEQLPKVEYYEDHLFVVLHALISTGDRVDTHEIDCFVRPNLLVTVRSEPIVGLEWLWEAVQTYPHLAEHGADELFAQLSEVIGRRYLEVLDEVERRVDQLSDPALAADQQVLAEIQMLRREESTIRRVLRPQRLVLATLRSSGQSHLRPEALRIVGDAYDVHNLVVESLAATRGLLTDTLDTYRGASAERQASAATLLTVYAAILLPLSVITGWYGMNLANLPGSGDRRGWVAVTAVMATIAVASWLLFVRAGLIRRPRLARRHEIVRGLSATALAPVRPFTMLWRPGADRVRATVRNSRAGRSKGGG